MPLSRPPSSPVFPTFWAPSSRLPPQLDVTYGVNSIGMKYERMLFGMKISDANCLAKAIQATETLASLVLQVTGDVGGAWIRRVGAAVVLVGDSFGR